MMTGTLYFERYDISSFCHFVQIERGSAEFVQSISMQNLLQIRLFMLGLIIETKPNKIYFQKRYLQNCQLSIILPASSVPV